MNSKLDGDPGGRTGADIPAPRQSGFSFRNLRTFSSFKNPVYRYYYGGMIGQIAHQFDGHVGLLGRKKARGPDNGADFVRIRREKVVPVAHFLKVHSLHS